MQNKAEERKERSYGKNVDVARIKKNSLLDHSNANGWGESEMYIQRRTVHIIDVNCNHRMCAGIVCAPSYGYNIQEIVGCIINIQKIITVYE